MHLRTILLWFTAGALPASLAAQGTSAFTAALAEHPAVRDALAHVDQHFDAQVAEWIRITEIPGTSRAEAARAAYLREQLEAAGLTVQTDSIGNVIARRPGRGGGPTVVFAAHLDTVHPEETDVTVRREDGRVYAPGVFDNSASVANMLAAVRALDAAGLETLGDVIFLGTVQEELGLHGMHYWLRTNPGVAAMVVALDGGLGSVNYGALGIYWSRMVFRAPGAHTLNSRGRPHPARAAARCILDLYELPLPPPDAPVTAVYNVGMLRGGHVVNAIAEEIAFTVDLRTVDPVLLAQLDSTIVATCEAAAAAEEVTFAREWIQRNEAGGTPDQLANRRDHPVAQTAVDILRYLGVALRPGGEAVPTGSTDANAAVVRGIPAISVGRGRGGDQHSLAEWADIESTRIATKQIVLLAAALAEVAAP